MLYKNTSRITKTFYGVSVKPGETKDVAGYVNDPDFVLLAKMPKEPPKRVQPVEPTSTKKEKITRKEDSVDGTDSNK